MAVINPATGKPFTAQDLVNSGEFTANPGVYGPSATPEGIRAQRAAAARDKANKPDPGADFLRAMAGYFAPPPQQDYSAAFQAGLQQARGNIADQLHGALSDIANSQAKAGQALGQYAPMVNNDFQEERAAGKGALNAMTAYDTAAGVGNVNNGVLGGGRQTGPAMAIAKGEMAPEMAATAATHREDLSDQALLNTGIQQSAAHDTSLANLAAQQAYGQLDAQALQFQQAQALANQQEAYAEANARQAFGYSLLSNAQAAKLNKEANNPNDPNSAQNQASMPGIYAPTGLTRGEVTTVRKMPQYKSIIKLIDSGDGNAQELARMYGQKYPNLMTVLQVERPDFFADPTQTATGGYADAQGRAVDSHGNFLAASSPGTSFLGMREGTAPYRFFANQNKPKKSKGLFPGLPTYFH